MNCEQCIFFKSMMKHTDQGIGKCVRYSPRSGSVQTGGDWPFVYYDQVCGEFKSRVDGNDYEGLYEYEDVEHSG